MKHAAEKISKRQRQVLELLSQGKERKEICEELGLSMGTVNTYASRLYARLGTTSPASSLRTFIEGQHPKLKLF